MVGNNFECKDRRLSAAFRLVRRAGYDAGNLSFDDRRCTARDGHPGCVSGIVAPVKRGRGRRGAPAKATRARNLRNDCIVAVLLGVCVSVKNGGS